MKRIRTREKICKCIVVVIIFSIIIFSTVIAMSAENNSSQFKLDIVQPQSKTTTPFCRNDDQKTETITEEYRHEDTT